MRDAWRSFSGESWTALLGEDRERRGPVEGDAPAPPLAPATPTAAPAPAADDSEPEEPSQYGDFMGKVARSRPRRFHRPGSRRDVECRWEKDPAQ